MAGKRHKGGRKNAPRTEKAGGDIAIAERELGKGNAKVAVKHARVAYRVDPSESTVSLLRRALLQRTRELQGRNLRDEARAVLAELSGLATSHEDDVQEVRRLQILLGVGDARLRAEDVVADKGLLFQVVDEAVMVGDVRSCPTEQRSEVGLVRAALQAISAGAGEECLASLQPIGRGSPLADWRLLARGLIAYYEGDDDRREANWSRLDPERAPSRIAGTLTAAASPSPSQRVAGEHESYRLAAASALVSHPAMRPLEKLQESLAHEADDWDQHFLAIKRQCAASDPVLYERISTAVAYSLIGEGKIERLKRLKMMGPLLTSDPRMNRVFAHFFELENEEAAAAHHWGHYLNDVKELAALSDASRPTACALIACRAAQMFHLAAIHSDGADSFWSIDEDSSSGDGREANFRLADEYFALSRSFDPDLRKAYTGQCRSFAERDDLKQASQLYKKFAFRFSNDFDAQLEAMSYFRIRAKDPEKALEFGRAAQLLRPRDGDLATNLWQCRFDLAVIASRNGSPAKARLHLDAAAEHIGPGRESYALAAMRAAVELKAGNEAEAAVLQRRSIAEASEPAMALLAVCASTCRCSAKSDVRKRLNSVLEACLKTEASTSVGASMARYLWSLNSEQIDYRGKKTHEKLLRTYLNRVLRMSWQEADLVDVCEFAMRLEDVDPFLQRLGTRGRRLFPHNPWFPFSYARGLRKKGRADRAARLRMITALKRAISLNNKHPNFPLPKRLLTSASCLLEIIESIDFHSSIGLGGWGAGGFDAEAALEEIGFDPEIFAELAKMGISLSDVLAAIQRGEDPQEFIDRFTR